MSAADHAPVRDDRAAVRAARRRGRRAGRSSRRRRCATTRSTSGRCSRSCTSSAARSRPADGSVLARSVQRAGRHVPAHVPDRLAVRPPRRLRERRAAAALRDRALPQRRAVGPGRRARLARRPAAGQAPAGRRGRHDARPGRRSRSRPTSCEATGSAGAVVALDPRTGAVQGDGERARLRPERRSASPAVFRALNSDAPARRCSTARRSAATRPARPSRSLTAAAAIDSGKYTPDSVINGDSPKDDLRRADARTTATTATATSRSRPR